jgi:hypothetical protein
MGRIAVGPVASGLAYFSIVQQPMRCPELAELPSAPLGKTGWPWKNESHRLPHTMADGRSWPRISIVTPSYNQGQFIEETIRSVLLQGYPNLEYIVIDGDSTDASVDTIRRYAPWLAHWSSERDEGQSDAINKGLRLAKGDIVAWLNSDDLLTPGALQAVAARFASEKEPAVVCGSAELRAMDLSTVKWTFDSPPTKTRDILAYPEGRHIGQPSVFMSRKLLDFPDPLRRDLHYVMDFELWLRLSKKRDLTPVPDTLSWLRHHPDAKTFRDNHRVFQELASVLAEHAEMLSHERLTELIKVCRRQEAHAYIDAALHQVGAKGKMEPFRLILRALRLDPRILTVRTFYALIGRICLPQGLLRHLLRSR